MRTFFGRVKRVIFHDENPDIRVWVLLHGKSVGPFPVSSLRHLGGFMLSTPVRRVASDPWRPAYQVIDLKQYFGTQRTGSSLYSGDLDALPFDASAEIAKQKQANKKRSQPWKLLLLFIVPSLFFVPQRPWKSLLTQRLPAAKPAPRSVTLPRAAPLPAKMAAVPKPSQPPKVANLKKAPVRLLVKRPAQKHRVAATRKPKNRKPTSLALLPRTSSVIR